MEKHIERHARQLLQFRRLDTIMSGMTVAAAMVWLPFAYRQAQLQRLATPGDTHATMEHRNRIAAFALFLLVWSLLGASDRPGWRLTAWTAGLASTWYGPQSLLFATAAFVATPLWAVAAVWGLTYIVVAERRARATASRAGAAAVQPAIR